MELWNPRALSSFPLPLFLYLVPLDESPHPYNIQSGTGLSPSAGLSLLGAPLLLLGLAALTTEVIDGSLDVIEMVTLLLELLTDCFASKAKKG